MPFPLFFLAWMLFLFPAAGALINLFAGHKMNKTAIGSIATGAAATSFAIGLLLTVAMMTLPVEERTITVPLYEWITIGNFSVGASLLVDPLSMVMVLVVTGVGSLIHLYSMSYMADDERYQRYFVYLNFFVLAMLILVLSDNFLAMFVGWEGVGLASFLLIGFWFDRRDDTYGYYADAGKKAFLVNRVGDFGLIVAMALIWTSLGTLDFLELNDAIHANGLAIGVAGMICLLLLLGAAGKSAQIPLYVWLPDAMAGPTPVSALIHAATMVTAGIYMIARTNVLWHISPQISLLAAVIGVLTAFFAATIALVQTDLKKILAYSTVSQLGYMMVSVGVGAYGAAIFHLTTHAFFKALLFLGAGSVMHATHGELDIRKMGGLKQKMPITYWTFLIGVIALAGIPPLSGFFSKDAILLGALDEAPITYVVGMITAFLTAVYSFRMFFLVFSGKPRDRALYDHAHESPSLMTWPLIILAALTAVAGLLNLPFLLSMEYFLEPAVGHPHEPPLAMELAALTFSFIVAVFGFVVAYSLYRTRENWVQRFSERLTFMEPVLQNAYYVDEFYSRVIVSPLLKLSDWFAGVFDPKYIDGFVNGIGQYTLVAGERIRFLQNGKIPTYALSIFVGVVVIVVAYIFGG
jgi:NADH-quinone oxidoreductase subunit L